MPVILATGEAKRRIAQTEEAEVAVRPDRAIALQPGRQEHTFISKKKLEKKKKLNVNRIVMSCILT